MFLTQIPKKKSVQNVWKVYVVLQGTILVPSGLELSHLSVTGNQKFEIPHLVRKHKSFIKDTLLQPLPLPKPWILAQLESFFHKCMLAFWTCKTPRKSPFS